MLPALSTEPPQPSAAAFPRTIVLTEIEAMGGAERSVLALCRFLHERGVPHRVATCVDHIGLEKHADTPVEVVQLRPVMAARAKVSALRRYFSHVPPSAPKPLMSGYQPALHATLAGLRGFHCLMHDTPSLFESEPERSLQQSLARRASDAITGFGLRSGGKTIVTSEYLQAECRRVFGADAAIARMGGLSGTQSFLPRAAHGTLNLLSVSRLEPNKRLDWLLRALGELEQSPEPPSKEVNWQLHIVGRGAESVALLAMAHAFGLASRVHFHGFVPDEALEALYGQAHLFLMPAVQGYGIPAVEALSRGIPVLLHRDSGVSDILQNTPWATVVAGGEAEMKMALQSAIRKALTGEHRLAPLPEIPSEAEWAERVAKLCGWL